MKHTKFNSAPNVEEGIKQLQIKARETSNIDESKAFGQELRKEQETVLSRLDKEAETEKPVVPEKKEKKVELQSSDKQNCCKFWFCCKQQMTSRFCK